jgi:hypothetical protein
MSKLRCKTKKPTSRNRHNISLDESVRARGEELAAAEKRSFSNLLEVLIDREWSVRFGKEKAA